MSIICQNIKKQNIRNSTLTILLIIFYFSYFLKMISGNHTIWFSLANFMMVSIGFLGLVYFAIICKFKGKSRILLIFTTIYLFLLLSSLYTNNYRIQDYILPLQYFGVSMIIIGTKLSNKLMRWNFLIYCIYFAFLMLQGVHPDNVFSSVSRNNISIIMIIQTLLLYISDTQNNSDIKLIPSVITVIFSFWGIGRSGIITSLVLLLGIVIINLFYQKSSKKKVKFFGAIIVVTVLTMILVTFYYDVLFSKALNRSMLMGLVDTNRNRIIGEYYHILGSSFASILFGVPLFTSSIFSFYDYNLHNSFLRLHAYYGLFGFLIIFALLILSFINGLKKKRIFYLLFLLVLLLRMSTDIASFNGPFDPLLYYFIFKLAFKKETTL